MPIQPIDITQKACEDHVRELADAMGRNRSWIYKICSDPEHDYYSRFRFFLAALETVNPTGVDLIIKDLLAWQRALRSPQEFRGDWPQAIGRTMVVAQEAFAIGIAGPSAEFEEKANLVIGSLEWLLSRGHVEE